jgi:hypothetical protein
MKRDTRNTITRFAILLIAALCLAASVTSVTAATGFVGLYADAAGTDCNILDVPGLVSFYVVHTGTDGATGVEFSAPLPSGFTGAGGTFLADEVQFPVYIGDSQTGLSVAYGSCLTGPIHVATILAFSPSGTTPSCTQYPVLPHPARGVINVPNCDSPVGEAPGDGLIATINADAGCVCGESTSTTYFVVNTNDSGAGSLRAAIGSANAIPGLDLIHFDIPGPGPHVIRLQSALPDITNPVIIDGYTQSGASPNTNAGFQTSNAVIMIQLDGQAGPFAGLTFAGSSNSSAVRGLSIVNFGGDGILLTTSDNTVDGCFIGVDASGVRQGNGGVGVNITQVGMTIGGATPGARNVISDNTGDGVSVAASSSGARSLVQGNFIGTDPTGTTAFGNGGAGVSVGGSNTGAMIGGDASGAGNLISANDVGVVVSGLSGIQVLGNRIGTDVTGTQDLGNTSDGVRLIGGIGHTVGGSAPGARNIISGNGGSGVLISILGRTHTVQGNYIGTDVSGTSAIANLDGVTLITASNTNVIGGTSAAQGNVISGNTSAGVLVNGANDNFVQGNYIGTDAAGTSAVPNSVGVLISGGGADNHIGGASPAGAGNVISGNQSRGVYILGPGPTGNTVEGNKIGADVTGTTPMGNSSGVEIALASNNTIGGSADAGSRNTITANGMYGIIIWGGPDATGNRVWGNTIGGASGLGNGAGVYLWDAFQTTVGGTGALEPNVISYNSGDGVTIGGAGQSSVRSNSIHSNGGLGIDLGDDDVTSNDGMDGDTGPNGLQNFPLVTASTSASTTVEGSFNSTPSTPFILEFFANSSCDASGNGEGETFIGSVPVTTDGSGDATFNETFPTTVPAGDYITATATDPDGNTSEFSQ